MSVKIMYFVHGASLDNEQGISSGWNDPALSALGIKQAGELKDKIQGQKFDAVFCSDLKRAVETAQIVFEGNVPITLDSRLRECNYGQFNGQPESIVNPLKRQHIIERFPDGESYEDVKTRLRDFLNFIKKDRSSHSIAFLAHQGPQLALEVLLHGKSWSEVFDQDWRNTKTWQAGWAYEVR